MGARASVLPPVGIASFQAPSALSLSNSGTINPQLSHPGTYQILCQTTGFCPATATTEFTIYPQPRFPQMEVTPGPRICANDSISFQLTAYDGVSFSYYLNDSSLNNPFFFAQLDSLNDGDRITGVIGNAFGCTDSIHQHITVLPRPELIVTPPSGSILRNGELDLQVEASIPQTSVDWSLAYHQIAIDSGLIGNAGPGTTKFMDLELSAENLDPSRYQLELNSSTQGCTGETYRLEYQVLNHPFFVPEVFTPNGDGQNDVWQVVWLDQVRPEDYTLIVFNRSGGEVHRMGAFGQWDGGSVPDGVYWWILKGGQGAELQRGGLTIRRK